jgi:phytoene dehydrogenase-like protein
MTEEHDVLVVGGGLAGLCAGAYAARDGNSVLVCEQSDQTGGYFRSFTREGFTFDTGLKAVEDSGMLLPMLRQLDLESKVNLHKITSALALPDDFIPLHDRSDIREFYSVLGDHFPDQRRGLEALLRQSRKIAAWVNLMGTIPNPLFEEPRKILPKLGPWAMKNLPAILSFRRTQSLLEVPMTEFLGRYLTDPALVRVMTGLFFGGTPALFGLGYERVFLDYYYAHDGMQSLTDALSAYVQEHGGEIRTGTAVSRILVRHKRVAGVELADGKQICARYVIAAADMKHTFLDMTDPEALPPAFITRLRDAGIGESAVCVFLGTDIAPAALPVDGCSHIYFLPDYQGIEAVDRMNDDFFERTPLEMSIPCLNNPSLAPPGKSGIVISALAKYEFAGNWGMTEQGGATPQYYALKERVGNQLVKMASRVIPRLEEHILFREVATPRTYRRYTLNSGGSICGWTYDRQTTFHRKGTAGMQKSMLTPVHGLLQAGHWTVYPGGAPVSILSARLAAEHISRHGGKKRKWRE